MTASCPNTHMVCLSAETLASTCNGLALRETCRFANRVIAPADIWSGVLHCYRPIFYRFQNLDDRYLRLFCPDLLILEHNGSRAVLAFALLGNLFDYLNRRFCLDPTLRYPSACGHCRTLKPLSVGATENPEPV